MSVGALGGVQRGITGAAVLPMGYEYCSHPLPFGMSILSHPFPLDGVIFCLRVGNGVGKAKGTHGVYSVSP